MGRIIGIDLGTTNSVVAIMNGSEPEVIVNAEGDRTTPSVVAWADDEVLVGTTAKRQAVTNPGGTIFSAKRFIGRRFEECSKESSRVPYKVVRRSNGDAGFDVNGREVSPPEVAAHVLRKLKKTAEDYLGQEVTEAVITVPAYYNDSQRQATKDAGKIAGLEVKRIVNEPTAAALAYGLDRKDDQLIAVYDFGGGTFDISILEVGDNVVQVISTNGDTHLGGDDVDHEIVDYLIAEFKKDTGLDVKGDKMVLQRLKDAAEQAKIELSSKLETTVSLPFLTADKNGQPQHLNIRITRAKLEAMIEDIINRSLEPCKKALADAGKKANQIDEIVLVGGSTRIPLVQETVKKFFGKDPHRGVNPDEVVGIGAAIQAGVLAGDVQDMVLLDVTPLSLGVETQGGVMTPLIERNTTIPTEKSDVFSTAADNQPKVQIHVLQGERGFAKDNRTLGEFSLDGILPAPRGVPKIKVTFSIDANGILSVSARDEATGKDQKITITSNSGLDDSDIDRMVEEAKQHEEDDAKRRGEVEKRNQADQLCYQIEKALGEAGDKLPADKVKDIEGKVSSLRAALEADDFEKIESEMATLESAMQELATAAYGAQAPPGTEPAPGAEAAGADAAGDDGVIDAEFEESD